MNVRFTATLALMIEDYNNAVTEDRWELKERLAVTTAIGIIGQLNDKSRALLCTAAHSGNSINCLPELCNVTPGRHIVDGKAYDVEIWGEEIFIFDSNPNNFVGQHAHTFCLNDKQVDDEIRAARAYWDKLYK